MMNDYIIGGGGSSSQAYITLIKGRVRKSFFQLIKAYKRYYFGIWLLKLLFYKLINKPSKVKKWSFKRLERKNFLYASRKRYKALQSIYPQVKIWLSSLEFKEKYLKHPYPPFLNPCTIEYEKISADLAYELNLPLPEQNYDLINISNGCSASAATLVFLKECGVSSYSVGQASYETYKEIYQHKAQQKHVIFFYYSMLAMFDKTNVSHFFKASLTKKVPFLYIARCPIERIRCVINHFDSNPSTNPLHKTFTLRCAYDEIIPQTKYWYSKDKNKPDLSLLEDIGENRQILHCVLALQSILEMLKDNISFVECVEFNDLKKENAFETFCKLASIFGFLKPLQKENFENRIWNKMYSLFPVTLICHPDDLHQSFDENSAQRKGGFHLIITLPHYLSDEQKDFVDLSAEIEDGLSIDEVRILILISKDDLAKFKADENLYAKSIEFIKGYLNALKKQFTQDEAMLVTEEQILQFLSSNEESRYFIEKTLNAELCYLKENYPHFFDKWKYYKEFEKICQKL